MNLRYSKRFIESFRKLSPEDKKAVLLVIELFQENPFAPSLRNHGLVGKMTGKGSLAVDLDLRIVFAEKGDYEDVTLLDVGGHVDVYRR